MVLMSERMVWGASTVVRSFFLIFAFSVTNLSQTVLPVQSPADTLVQQLRDLPTPLPASVRSNGSVQPEERQRHKLYGQIRRFGNEGVLALSRGLLDEDVQLRKNVALAFNVLAGGWFDRSWPKLDIKSGLPALISALQDSDGSVRAWSAQAIGEIGPDAAQAVPALVTLLSNTEEGSRNSACIALRGIGPAAKEALPALLKSLADPSKDVRQFAAQAINSIQQ